MDALVNTISDFLAAVLARFGYVGRARRRAGIHDDLALLAELRDSDDFGADSDAHRYLSRHVTSEIAHFSGVALGLTKRRQWASILLAFAVCAPLAYWTYTIVDDGFDWYALFPGIVGGLFLIAALGMLIEGEMVEPDEPEDAGRP